jgi:molybdenum cofactor cytidylyltransferase
MGTPKALLQYQGQTFLDRLIGLFARHCSPVIVVLGAQPDGIRQKLHRADEAQLVDNPDYPLGQITSMQCGLRALPRSVDRVLFTLADHPAVQPRTVAGLMAVPPAPLRIPRYAGRRGHPIVFSAALIPEFLGLPVTGTARDVVTRHARESAYMDVDDPGILADIDDPDAYRRLLAEIPA